MEAPTRPCSSWLDRVWECWCVGRLFFPCLNHNENNKRSFVLVLSLFVIIVFTDITTYSSSSSSSFYKRSGSGCGSICVLLRQCDQRFGRQTTRNRQSGNEFTVENFVNPQQLTTTTADDAIIERAIYANSEQTSPSRQQQRTKAQTVFSARKWWWVWK